ncbi:Histone-lysine N-methyltransferase pr-set7, partial [Harpegnathos saltator]
PVNAGSTNHSITDYFPVRRSVRKCKKAVLEEKQRDIENKVVCQVEEGLEVRYFPGKGRGVITTREFTKGEYVVEYIGELISQAEAKVREEKYAQDQNTGCYMYYFQHRNQQYCVDATAETDKLGRLVNHSRNGNLVARIIEVGSIPHLVLTAKEDIPIGVEVTYDYGDRSRESIRYYPWLAL